MSKIPAQQANVDELSTARGQVLKLYKKAYNPKSVVSTICHGDPWVGNLMFLYETDKYGIKRVADVKFLDFQLISLGNSTCDIAEIIASSVQAYIQENQLQEILQTYHTKLTDLLYDLNMEMKYPYCEFLSDYEKTFFCGYFKSMLITSLFALHDKDEMVKLLEKFQDKSIEEINAITNKNDEGASIKFKELEDRFVITCANLVKYGVLPA